MSARILDEVDEDLLKRLFQGEKLTDSEDGETADCSRVALA